MDKMNMNVGDTGKVVALTTSSKQEPFEFEGELLAWASKRTNARLEHASPIAYLRLYKNLNERVKPQARYILAFEKTDCDGMIIVASYRGYPSLEKMAEKSPRDKMHRRICNLAGVPQNVGGI